MGFAGVGFASQGVPWLRVTGREVAGRHVPADVAEVGFWWAGVRLGAVLRGVGFVLENGHRFT
jgi:hypothetical protein